MQILELLKPLVVKVQLILEEPPQQFVDKILIHHLKQLAGPVLIHIMELQQEQLMSLEQLQFF